MSTTPSAWSCVAALAMSTKATVNYNDRRLMLMFTVLARRLNWSSSYWCLSSRITQTTFSILVYLGRLPIPLRVITQITTAPTVTPFRGLVIFITVAEHYNYRCWWRHLSFLFIRLIWGFRECADNTQQVFYFWSKSLPIELVLTVGKIPSLLAFWLTLCKLSCSLCYI